jgi:hypothetical protein
VIKNSHAFRTEETAVQYSYGHAFTAIPCCMETQPVNHLNLLKRVSIIRIAGAECLGRWNYLITELIAPLTNRFYSINKIGKVTPVPALEGIICADGDRIEPSAILDDVQTIGP